LPLPVLWQEWIEIKSDQPYYKGDIQMLKFKIIPAGEKYPN